MLTTLFHIFLASIGLGVLIFVHELGHYWMARRVGMRVETFSIGFGKALFKWDRQNGERWQIGWLPIGGFVKIAGTDKDDRVDPYTVKDGFFGKSPWARMKVAFMGPFVNLIFAALLFVVIWIAGGKPEQFLSQTSMLGWVDPASELFQDGVRPGDEILAYNGQPFTGIKDHIVAPLFADDGLQIDALKNNYETKESRQVSLNIKPYTVFSPRLNKPAKVTGILAPAQFLTYKGHPGATDDPHKVASAGIKAGDQLVWLDGDLVFSLQQVQQLTMKNQALLTIQRGGDTFVRNVPRFMVEELRLDPATREELTDWQWEADLNRTALSDLFYIPYDISSDNFVQRRVRLLTKSDEQAAFPTNPYSSAEEPLEPGDRIIAVDGKPVSSADQLLKDLQEKVVHMIVYRDGGAPARNPIGKTQELYKERLDLSQIDKIANHIGTSSQVDSYGPYVLLSPVIPKKWQEHTPPEWIALARPINAEGEEEEASEDYVPPRVPKEILLLDTEGFSDSMVNVNPKPWVPLMNSANDVWNTLEAILNGTINSNMIMGPLGIVAAISHSWGISYTSALWWLAVISLNLALINLIPLPVLDGGSICLSFLEMVTKKRLSMTSLERLIIPFIIIILCLLLWFTFNDIMRVLGVVSSYVLS